MIPQLLAAAVLVFSGPQSVRLTGFADGHMYVDFGSEIDQMNERGEIGYVIPRLCCGKSVMSADGTIWYSTGAALVRVRNDRVRTRDAFRIANVNTLEAGPDGSVWFNNGYYDRTIGHIEANGTIRTFPDPLAVYDPREGTLQIVVSNDGAAWCKGMYFPFLARVDVDGSTTMTPHYSEITRLASPAPRGGVWVGNLTHVDRYDTTDHVAESFPLFANDFVATNDGAFWYSDGANVVQWKSGTVTKFPIERPSSGYLVTVSQIVPESDSTVWVLTNTAYPVPLPSAESEANTQGADAYTHIYRITTPSTPKRHAAR